MGPRAQGQQRTHLRVDTRWWVQTSQLLTEGCHHRVRPRKPSQKVRIPQNDFAVSGESRIQINLDSVSGTIWCNVTFSLGPVLTHPGIMAHLGSARRCFSELCFHRGMETTEVGKWLWLESNCLWELEAGIREEFGLPSSCSASDFRSKCRTFELEVSFGVLCRLCSVSCKWRPKVPLPFILTFLRENCN